MEIKKISYKIIFFILAILLIIFIKPNETFAYWGSISEAKITLNKSSYFYTGKQIKPSITVKIDGEKLKKDEDYTVSYSSNTNVGTAKITIKGKGLLRWGSVSKTFKITKTDIEDTDISYKVKNYYTGKEIKPSVTVKLGNEKIKKDDYTLSFSNNVKVGTGKITIKGKGNLKGSITKTFKINKCPIEDTIITLSSKSFEYTGKAIKPSVTIKSNGTTLKKGTDYTISYSNNINPGTAKVIITGKENYEGTTIKTFKIDKCNLEDKSTMFPTLAYNWVGNNSKELENDSRCSDGIYNATLKSKKGGKLTYEVTSVNLVGKVVSSKYDIYVPKNTDKKTIKLNSVEGLTKGKDYKVSYKKDSNKNITKIEVTGIGNYIGTVTIKIK